jgi:prepilin-type N-terminal cleavage/methylation domain-containing protein
VSRPQPEGNDAGVTLIELVITIGILGITFVAMLGGMFTFQTSATNHARQADGADYIRQYAEVVSALPYQTCTATYVASGFTVPSGWTASLSTTYWNGASFSATCPATDSGLDAVHLSLTSTDGRDTETLDVVKRAS